jgi:hypothetical protein
MIVNGQQILIVKIEEIEQNNDENSDSDSS